MIIEPTADTRTISANNSEGRDVRVTQTRTGVVTSISPSAHRLTIRDDSGTQRIYGMGQGESAPKVTTESGFLIKELSQLHVGWRVTVTVVRRGRVSHVTRNDSFDLRDINGDSHTYGIGQGGPMAPVVEIFETDRPLG